MKLNILLLTLLFIIDQCKGLLDHKLHNYDIVTSVNVHTVTKRSLGGIPKTEMDLSLFGKKFTLELEPTQGLFSREFKIIAVMGDNSEEEVFGFDKTHFYTGHVKGESSSRASIHLDKDDVATGVFTAGGEEFFMEPLLRHVDSSERDFHPPTTMVAYRKSDIKSDGTQSGLCGSVHPNISAEFDEILIKKFNPDVKPCVMQAVIEYNIYNKNGSSIPVCTKRKATGSDEHGRYKRQTGSNTACAVYAIADYRYFQHMGQSNMFTTAENIANIFNRVNSIYKLTDFSGAGAGYSVEIDKLIIHTAPTVSGDAYAYNSNKTNWGTTELLQALGSTSIYGDKCLAHLFTSIQMPDSVLGLAYIASSQENTLGGICSPTQRSRIYNIGWTSSLNGAGSTLLFSQSSLVTAHEFGHNWGSEHDPTSGGCAPSSIISDGKYLMYAYSVTGEDPNNDLFSSCSRGTIGGVLVEKAASCFQAPAEESLCGNGRIDPGEECDEGFWGRVELKPDSGLTSCCTAECTLKAGATCSPVNYRCCTNECQMATPGVPCASAVSCQDASTCNGGFDCPPGANRLDGTSCLDGGSCVAGVCQSFCEYRGYDACVCDTVDTSCKVCCRNLTSRICLPYEPLIDLADGRSCVQGYCNNGACVKVSTRLVERLWDLIDAISVDLVIEAFKTNMIACVTGFSLLLYIPICIGVWCYDRHRKRKWKKENSFTVRKDRTLAHDEDKRPIGGGERPVSNRRPAPSDTDDYMVPLPRRPGSSSRNTIQPLDHKPSASRA